MIDRRPGNPVILLQNKSLILYQIVYQNVDFESHKLGHLNTSVQDVHLNIARVEVI